MINRWPLFEQFSKITTPNSSISHWMVQLIQKELLNPKRPKPERKPISIFKLYRER